MFRNDRTLERDCLRTLLPFETGAIGKLLSKTDCVYVCLEL